MQQVVRAALVEPDPGVLTALERLHFHPSGWRRRVLLDKLRFVGGNDRDDLAADHLSALYEFYPALEGTGGAFRVWFCFVGRQPSLIRAGWQVLTVCLDRLGNVHGSKTHRLNRSLGVVRRRGLRLRRGMRGSSILAGAFRLFRARFLRRGGLVLVGGG